jgi:alkanesulfonate monooxygenase SsuD/methylene tetrahydromethanopterin reductase-like flavin-dependent oxidoreductase (luciferase family)
VYSIRAQGGAEPYPDPDTVAPLADDQRAVVEDRLATQFVGDADEVADKLTALQRVTGADELVVTTATHRHADRLRSFELLAKRWGVTG